MARTLTGTVVSDSRDKTITVRVDRRVSHSLYKKQYVKSKKFHVHDEENTAKVGDVVEFNDHRPISKTKRWNLRAVVDAENAS